MLCNVECEEEVNIQLRSRRFKDFGEVEDVVREVCERGWRCVCCEEE